MNISKIREFIKNNNMIPNYLDVHSIGISTKIQNNINTDKLCIRFVTTRKKSVDSLDDTQKIPSEIIIDGVSIVTDVVELPRSSINNIIAKNGVLQDMNLDLCDLKSVVDNHRDTDTNYGINIINPDNLVDPLKQNYIKRRPLKCGISSHSSPDATGFINDGTLGLIVRDATDNSVVLLSNNHVYAKSQFLGYDAIYGTNLNPIGLSARQPGSNNPYAAYYPAYGGYPNAAAGDIADGIGVFKRSVPFQRNGQTLVDAAISNISNYSILDSNSTNTIGFTQSGAVQFATSDEIDSLMDINSLNYQSPIFKSGRTSGPLGYPGSIYTLNADITAVSSKVNRLVLPLSASSCSYRYITGLSNSTNVDSSYIFRRNPSSMIIVTSGTAVYHSGICSANSMYYIPSSFNGSPLITIGDCEKDFTKVGNFDYFNVHWVGDAIASIGLSAGKLVYCGRILRYVGNPGIVGTYKVYPSQLPGDYSNLKKIIGNGHALFLLSGTALYSCGWNYHESSVGYGGYLSNSTAWQRVPGIWDDIFQLRYGVLALSANELFYACGDDDYTYNWSLSVSNNYILSANRLNLGKFSKIYPSENGNLIFDNFALSADNKTLFQFTYDQDLNTYTKRQLSGVWDNTIKIINEGWSDTKLLLYNNSIYTYGAPVNSVYDTVYKNNVIPYTPNTDFLAASYNLESSEFNIVPGMTVSDIDGVASNFWRRLSNDPDYQGESLVYLSAGTWRGVGANASNIFAQSYTTKDHIVTSSVGSTIDVGGYLPNGSSINILDSIRIKSKENAFRVSAGGDSGSAVFALLSSTSKTLSAWKCIGLLYAGESSPTNSSEADICRIDHIVNQLKIKPWDGTIPTTYPVSDNITYTSRVPYLSTVTLSGRQFFNIGLSDFA